MSDTVYKKQKIKKLQNIKHIFSIDSYIKELLKDLKTVQLPEDLEDKVEINWINDINKKYGDLTTNIAFKIFNIQKQKFSSRFELAQKIAQELKQNPKSLDIFTDIQAVQPGFINFFLHKNIYLSEVLKYIDNVDIKHAFFKNKKMIIEFTDPNPFKEFHIGHVYSNTVGESISRMFESAGSIVKRACYQGDVGMHVAKTVWALLKDIDAKKITLKDIEKKDLKTKAYILGQYYAHGALMYEKDETANKEIKQINYLIYIIAQNHLKETKNWKPQVRYDRFLQKDIDIDIKKIEKIYINGRQWSLDYFEQIYRRLGTIFDFYFFESFTGETGAKLVFENVGKIFKKSQGAIIFEGSKYGLHDRVFINSFGLPTYEAKDIGLAIEKKQAFDYDISIIITGNEIDEYFKVIMKALSFIYPELEKKNIHISHGMLRLKHGKMSSRTGKVITGLWLIEKAKQIILKKVKQNHPEWSEEKKDFTAEKIAIGAIKYSLLSSQIGKDVIFDFETSLSFQGKSGPYILYTFARSKKIIQKAQEKGFKLDKNLVKNSRLQHKDIKNELLRKIVEFERIFINSIENIEPHNIANFSYELATLYNKFYDTEKIITNNIDHLNMAITYSVNNILRFCLNTLGIETIQEM